MQELDSQPHMDGFNGFSYHYSTDINGLALSDDSQVPQTYPPAFDPSTAGSPGLWFRPLIFSPTQYSSLGMRYHQYAGSHPINQGPSGRVRTQQPLDRAPPTHSQPLNLQTHTSPSGIWNTSITSQIPLPSATPAFEPPPAR